jgi:hypothetical protein
MNDDIAEQISRLSDADAIAALAFALDLEDASAQDAEQLAEIEGRLPEAFAATPDLAAEVAPADDAEQAGAGDVARATLAYLAQRNPGLVADAVRKPRPAGKRDLLTLAVGGLVVLALKADVQIKRNTAGKWSFSFRLVPTQDTALAGVLSKLMSLVGGGKS